jgi:uncharacterized OsmC-like protein
MAAKIRFQYDGLEIVTEGDLDRRGRMGTADVPVHFCAVRATIRIRTVESDKRLVRLADLVSRYCPVDSLVKAAVPDYEVSWERLPISTAGGEAAD